MAIAFRVSGEAHTTNGNLTVTIPGTVQAGDTLIIVGGLNDGGNAELDWATPSGWTRLDGRRVSTNLFAAAYTRVAQAGDAGSSVTFISATTGKSCAIIAAYSGTDPVTQINVAAGQSETVTTTSHATPAVATSLDNTQVVIACVASNSVAESWATTSGYTKRQDSLGFNAAPSGQVIATLQDKAAAALGTWGGESLTHTSATGKAATFTIAVAPASSTQISRPTSDVASSGATGIPTPGAGSGLYANLAANDDDHLVRLANAGNVQVGVSALVDPQSSSGHVVRYRARLSGGASAGDVTVTLKEGSTTIASWTDTLTGTFATYSHTLTSGQADAISDYGSLNVTFSPALT